MVDIISLEFLRRLVPCALGYKKKKASLNSLPPTTDWHIRDYPEI